MSKLTDGFVMGEKALGELKKIRNQIARANLIRLMELRHAIGKIEGSTINGVELSDDELYKMIEDLWDVSMDDAQ